MQDMTMENAPSLLLFEELPFRSGSLLDARGGVVMVESYPHQERGWNAQYNSK
jgi:hypothetical protein